MAHKIATCNYCGTRAALVLDRARHELACASCGAPLHDMKALPKAKLEHARPKGRPMPLPRQPYEDHRRHETAPKPRKRRKGLGRRLFDEIRDVIEDILD